MKNLSIIKYVLLIVSAVLVTLGMTGVMDVDTMLAWTAVMLGITVLLVIILPLIGIAQNPKGAKRGLIGLVIIALVFLVCFLLADATPVYVSAGTQIYDDKTGLIVSDMGIYAIYISLAGAILTIIGTEIYKSFK